MAHNTLEQISWNRRLSNSPAMNRLLAQTEVEKARLAQGAALQVFRLRTVGCVTRKAISEAGFISQHELQIAQTVPLAGSRAQAIAEIGVLALAEIVHETAQLVIS